MPLTPEERTDRARRAALIRWSRESPTKQAHIANRGLLAKFEREVDPAGELPEPERTRRANAALRAHMIMLARRSAKVRADRTAAAAADDGAE